MATCSDNVDASLILDTLIEKTGITGEQLDGTVEEGHLLKLAGLFGGWEKYVGVPGLGLNEAQKADVRDAVFREGHEKGMIKALTFWLKRNPYPSYRSLIEILLKLEEGLLAANVCNTGESCKNAVLYIVEAVYIYVVLSMYSVADSEGVLWVQLNPPLRHN